MGFGGDVKLDHLRVRDIVELTGAQDRPAWLPEGQSIRVRVLSFVPRGEDFGCVLESVPGVIPSDALPHRLLEMDGVGLDWPSSGAATVRPCAFARFEGWRQQVPTGEIEGRVTFRRTAFDVAEVFAESQTGIGSRYVEAHELGAVAQFAADRGQMVHFVEVYELEGDGHLPRIDLGLYGPDPDEQDAVKRFKSAAEAVDGILAAVAEGPNDFIFMVWTGPRLGGGG